MLNSNSSSHLPCYYYLIFWLNLVLQLPKTDYLDLLNVRSLEVPCSDVPPVRTYCKESSQLTGSVCGAFTVHHSSCRSSVPHRLSRQQLSPGGALELVFLPDVRLLSQATLLRGSHLACDFLTDAWLLPALPFKSFFIPLFFPRGQPCITSEGFP